MNIEKRDTWGGIQGRVLNPTFKFGGSVLGVQSFVFCVGLFRSKNLKYTFLWKYLKMSSSTVILFLFYGKFYGLLPIKYACEPSIKIIIKLNTTSFNKSTIIFWNPRSKTRVLKPNTELWVPTTQHWTPKLESWGLKHDVQYPLCSILEGKLRYFQRKLLISFV